MFEPTEEEARRDQALNHAIMSTESTPAFSANEFATNFILKRADRFEEWLKNGTEEKSPEPEQSQPRGAFGAYQKGGLDASSSEA